MISSQLSCISALTIFMPHIRNELLLQIIKWVSIRFFHSSTDIALSQTLVLAAYTTEGQDKFNRTKEVKNLRRHACSLFIKICQTYPCLLAVSSLLTLDTFPLTKSFCLFVNSHCSIVLKHTFKLFARMSNNSVKWKSVPSMRVLFLSGIHITSIIVHSVFRLLLCFISKAMNFKISNSRNASFEN